VKIKKENLKRLASISALGAGGLGVAASPAHASSMVFSGILDKPIGRKLPFANLDGAGGLFTAGARTAPQGSSDYWINVNGRHGANGTAFQFVGAVRDEAFAWGQRFGATWRDAACGRLSCQPLNKAFVADHAYSYRFGPPAFQFTAFNSTDPFLLFEFTGGDLPSTIYGWAQLKVQFDGRVPDAVLVDWAYDTSGAPLSAGDKGSATPEPSTLPLTGLAALVLGAKGLRAWRAAKRRTAAATSD
jgi:hypothetical protein